MELLATGFNAWGQLDFLDRNKDPSAGPDDFHSFQSILRGESIGHLHSLLECTFG